MAKSIKLSSAKPDASPPPVAAAATTTPPLRRSGPPLPIGIPMQAPSGMTSLEEAQLTRVGWSKGQVITPEMQAAMAEMRADANLAAETLVADPATPPIDFKTIDINKLPADQQGAYRQKISEATQAVPTAPNQLPQGAIRVINTLPRSQVEQKIAESKPLEVDYGEPDRQATRTVPDPNYVSMSTPEQAAQDIRTAEPVAPLRNCQHCGWDLAKPDIPEPSREEKLSFVTSYTLGDGKPYKKIYKLMGGSLEMMFRTLTMQEVDACYQQASRDNVVGNDWAEKIIRYRLFLQLCRVKSAKFDIELPDGLDKERNPNCDASWEFEAGEAEPLKLIEDYMMAHVLKTESLCRIATQTCTQFNRLVTALEIQVPNDSFWPATETPL